jgi:hypothetical protein
VIPIIAAVRDATHPSVFGAPAIDFSPVRLA